MSAILIKKNKIVGIGYNQIKTHPKSPDNWNMIHAEFHCLLGVDVSDVEGSTMFVYMEKKNSKKVGVAKPCPTCENMLRLGGVKKVLYTVYGGTVEQLQF